MSNDLNTTNRDKWTQAFANSVNGAATGNSVEGGKPTGGADKYSALETVSYKDMLSSKIQAANIRDQSMKYADAALNSTGLSGQGIAESARLGINNAYGRAVQEADQTHSSNLLNIQQQRIDDAEASSEEKWQSAMTMLQQAQSKEDIQYIRDNFYAGFTDDQKKYFDYYAASYSSGLNDASVSTGGEFSYENGNMYAYDENGGSVSTSGKFNRENETLSAAIATGKIAKGTYVQLHNKSNQDAYLYYGNDGKVYYVSRETYAAASGNKVHIIGDDASVKDGAYVNE